MYETIQIDQQGEIAILTFNRPDKLNAINRTVYEEMGDYLHSLERADTAASILILTGAGRAFIAGADIDDYTTMRLAQFSAFQRLGRSVMAQMEQLPRPIIAAVNGYALGGGFEIALASDVIIAAENAKFGLPEAKLGLLPGGGGTQRLTRLVGAYVAKRMIFSGETIDAQRAYQLNIATEIAPKGEALNAALALAKKFSITGRWPCGWRSG